jgi:hypothetical protein
MMIIIYIEWVISSKHLDEFLSGFQPGDILHFFSNVSIDETPESREKFIYFIRREKLHSYSKHLTSLVFNVEPRYEDGRKAGVGNKMNIVKFNVYQQMLTL